MKAKKRILSDELLQEIVRRIVAAVQPEKIILFGSAARGEMGPDTVAENRLSDTKNIERMQEGHHHEGL
jgi:predicted nucleotidyltransferase